MNNYEVLLQSGKTARVSADFFEREEGRCPLFETVYNFYVEKDDDTTELVASLDNVNGVIKEDKKNG